MAGFEKRPEELSVEDADGSVRRVSQDELESLVEERARQLAAEGSVPKTVPPPSAPSPFGALFDEIVLTDAGGVARRLTPAEFRALPLDQRVRAILRKQLRFYLRGREVPARTALKNY
jgi:hypothetical protein